MKFITLGIFLILALILTSGADAADNAMAKQKTIIWQGIVTVPTTLPLPRMKRLRSDPAAGSFFPKKAA